MRAIKAPFVVAIASVSGGGKTTAVKLLAEYLPNTKALYFDEYVFDGPENIMDWLNNGTDYNEWNLSPLLTELEALRLEPLEWILLDFPFANQHAASREYIDMTVFIDTPLDLALSRRLMRDFTSATKEEIMEDIHFYATAGRAAYLQMLTDILPNSDAVVDGSGSKEDVLSKIAVQLKKKEVNKGEIGLILHTEMAGSGEAVLFLHTGLQTSMTDFLPQQHAFNKNYQVVVPDLRGHGKSKTSDVRNFFEDSGVDLDETLESLGIESAHIVGASLGALAAIFLAKQFPHRIKSLTISGVTKQKPANWTELHQKDRDMQAELLRNEEAIAYFSGLHGHGWERFIHMGKKENWYPFRETKELSAISAPILVIAGDGNPTESHSAIAYGVEQDNVHTAIIPFASHLVHAEQPELYSKILEQFLKKV